MCTCNFLPPHFFPCPPVLLVPRILVLPPLPYAFPGVAAGGEPGWSWTTVRRPHQGPRGGPCEGGRPGPRGRPGLSRAPARTPQSPMCCPLEVEGSATRRLRMGGTGCYLGGIDRVCRLGERIPEVYGCSDALWMCSNYVDADIVLLCPGG